MSVHVDETYFANTTMAFGPKLPGVTVVRLHDYKTAQTAIEGPTSARIWHVL